MHARGVERQGLRDARRPPASSSATASSGVGSLLEPQRGAAGSSLPSPAPSSTTVAAQAAPSALVAPRRAAGCRARSARRGRRRPPRPRARRRGRGRARRGSRRAGPPCRRRPARRAAGGRSAGGTPRRSTRARARSASAPRGEKTGDLLALAGGRSAAAQSGLSRCGLAGDRRPRRDELSAPEELARRLDGCVDLRLAVRRRRRTRASNCDGAR